MSYEGYVKALCSKGHLRTWDAHDYPERTCQCGEAFVWHTNIDQTNCDTDPETGLEWGDVELVVAHPAEYKTCEHCKHSEMVEAVRYVIPTNAGHARVGNFELRLSNKNDAKVALKLTELGLNPDLETCWFNEASDDAETFSLHLPAARWPEKLIPEVPQEILDQDKEKGIEQKYEFSAGCLRLGLVDLLQCASVAELFEKSTFLEGGLSWRIAR